MPKQAETASSNLPVDLYTSEQVRQLDRLATQVDNIPSILLMKRAGKAAYYHIKELYPDVTRLIIFCGSGNNAGDGFIIAGLAAAQNMGVDLVMIKEPTELSGDALLAYEYTIAGATRKIHICELTALDKLERGGFEQEKCLIVDCLLGIGIFGDVAGPYPAVIDWINKQPLSVFSVDLPSGVCGDTGQVLGCAVRADTTLTFIGVKRGMLTGEAVNYVGKLSYADLDVSAQVFAKSKVSVKRIDLTGLRSQLPAREKNSHKGQSGHLLVVGGNWGMAGAVTMAAEAAMRAGTGLTSIVTRKNHINGILSRLPEVMVKGVESMHDLGDIIAGKQSIALGPGLGQDDWALELVEACIKSDSPLVIDADGLNLLAKGVVDKRDYKHNWVLTPHPGEAARLLHCSTADIQADRFAAVESLQNEYGGTIVLKGAGSMIANSGENEKLELCLASVGNPGMAVAGMGDLLTGVIASLIAQSIEPTQAAKLGVLLHGLAGDICAREQGEIGIAATDLIPKIRALINGQKYLGDLGH